MIGVFNNVQISIDSSSHNSGLLNRFNLLNSMVAFFCGLTLFDVSITEKWIDYYFKFNLAIMMVSVIVILFDIGTFPFFNTFSWSLIQEGNGSKKMIIAGISAASVLLYTLVFVNNKQRRVALIFLAFIVLLISGSRIFFLSGVFILLVSLVVKARIFGKSILILAGTIATATYILTTPVILLIPEKYQRLVIVFPPEYYTGKLAHLSESAAAASTSFRLNIWNMALKKIEEHPLIGNGFQAPMADYNFEGDILEGFQKIPAEILERDFLITGNLHNTFFSIAYLFGVPAFLFFLFFFARLIWLHYNKSTILDGYNRKVAIFITLVLIQYFITTLTSDVIYDLQFFFTLAVAVKIYIFYYKTEQPIR
ncbi:MAG: O-antigen ligase family protein [Cyclobacteriaceae bacterium]|nr:O-antigen ligase family protein [Cyclobacteriaceae bacterium]